MVKAFQSVVQAGRHQVVHHVVLGSDGVEHFRDLADLFFFDGFVTEMGGVVMAGPVTMKTTL
jgi:hypothetical protein